MNRKEDGRPKKTTPKRKEKKDEPKKEPYVPDQPLREFKGHGDWINAIAFSGDGKLIASASRDRTVKVWEAATGKEVATFKGNPSNIKGVVFLDGSAAGRICDRPMEQGEKSL